MSAETPMRSVPPRFPLVAGVGWPWAEATGVADAVVVDAVVGDEVAGEAAAGDVVVAGVAVAPPDVVEDTVLDGGAAAGADGEAGAPLQAARNIAVAPMPTANKPRRVTRFWTISIPLFDESTEAPAGRCWLKELAQNIASRGGACNTPVVW